MIKLRTVSTLAAGVAAALALGGTALAASGADDPIGSDDRGGAVEMLPNGDPVPTEPTTDPTPTATATTATPEAVPPTATAIDIATARAIALNATGGGRVTSIEAETEHGRAVWDIDVVNTGVRHDLDVDRSTGTILRHRTKSSNGSSSSSSERRGGRGSDDTGTDDHGRGGHGSDDSGSDDHGRGGHGSDD